ncbi:MAG: hypothetical protein PVI30_03375 [Myxococcales bacterium]|jgi:hypothetical protein
MQTPTRDSSPHAVRRLQTLRLARLATQRAEQGQAELDLEVDVLPPRASAPIVEPSADRAADAGDARRSRTTIERLADLRFELKTLQAERQATMRAAEAQIEHLTEKLAAAAKAPSTWTPYATVAVTGAAVFGLLVGGAAPWPEAPSAAAVPEAPEHFERELAEPAADPEVVAEAAEVALLETGEVPLVADDGETAAEGEPEPQPTPTRKRIVRTARPRPKPAAPAQRPAAVARPAASDALDPLAGIDDCGDDPLCGL